MPDWQTELTWIPPTENVDGTALDDLHGYWIYWGPESRDYKYAVYVGDESSSSYRFAPGAGPSYIAMTAVDADGNESTFSNEVVRTLAPAPVLLTAVVLPTSRSVEVGVAATAFAMVKNSSSEPARDCSITTALPFAGVFSYQETDAQTNEPVGPVNPTLNISPGGFVTAVISFEVGGVRASQDVALNFSCANSAPATILSGVNTVSLAVSDSPTPDVIALVSTDDGGGIVRARADGVAVFSVSSVNVGAAGTLTAMIDTGSESLPVALSICETTASGDCLETPSDSVTRFVDSSTSVTYSVFLQASGVVPLDPATNRVFVEFRDDEGVLRGSTSVAVLAQ